MSILSGHLGRHLVGGQCNILRAMSSMKQRAIVQLSGIRAI